MRTLSRREFVTGVLRGGVLVAALPYVPGALGCAARSAAVGDDPEEPAPEDSFFRPPPEVLRRVLQAAMERGGDFADVYWQHQTNQRLHVDDDKVSRAGIGVGMGVGVRVVKGEQTGYAYTEELTEESMLAAARTASLISSGTASSSIADPLQPVEVPGRYPARVIMTEVDLREKIAIVEKANALAKSADPRVERVQVVQQDVLDEVIIATSDGLIVHDLRPRVGLMVTVVASQNGRRERNSYHMGGRRGAEFFSDETIAAVSSEAVRRTLLLFDAIEPPAGTMPVVMAPGSSGILLHEAIGHGLEADFNRKDLSVYAGRLGEKVASELCTVVDSGLHEGDSGSLLVDDEGTLTERTVLIEKGALRTYMQDKLSAAVMGAPLTGNGRRQSYKHFVQPRMRVTYMEPGPHEKDEIIASVDRGIYALSFTNGQVHIGPGDFSFYVNYGFLIEDGKVGPPIKDVNLIGNGPEVLSRVTMVGNDLEIEPGGFGGCGKGGQWVPVGFGQPHVKVSAIAVGGVDGAGHQESEA